VDWGSAMTGVRVVRTSSSLLVIFAMSSTTGSDVWVFSRASERCVAQISKKDVLSLGASPSGDLQNDPPVPRSL
jgi:hypothetical protein